jgi:hypothetical protein
MIYLIYSRCYERVREEDRIGTIYRVKEHNYLVVMINNGKHEVEINNIINKGRVAI